PAASAAPVAGTAAPAAATAQDTTRTAAPTAASAASTAPATTAPTAAEDDFAAIYGQGEAYNPVADPNLPAPVGVAATYDPWEKFNRHIHAFNNVVDRSVARPLAKAYVKAVPRPVRIGVSNFFNNLGQPLTVVNSLLQGRPGDAWTALGRFLINSTAGIGGLFDPASHDQVPYRSEDFGQTLGVWGWQRSRYLELPFFGPRTVRDAFGLLGDAPLSPLQHIEEDKVRIGLQGLQLVDVRAQLLSIDAMREGAVDEYALYRDAWLQRRSYQINRDGPAQRGRKAQDSDLPPYLLEDEDNPTVPMDAMPTVLPGTR
ncbi:MAG: VacJ family lipoprotein, partial [Pseudoxanthomonas sp.]